MTETTVNLTNPGETPVDGDLITRTGANYSVTEQYYGPEADPTDAEIAQVARDWRNAEIESTDFVVPLTDHPQHAAYITYRAALRNWPSTSDFPDTKPTLGS